MASVRQKGGKWYYRITMSTGGNSHKYIERGSFRTKKEALEAGKRAEIALKDGTLPERQKFMSFNFLSDEWVKQSINDYKESTIFNHKKNLRIFVTPILGNYNIAAIDYRLCQKVIDEMVGSGHSKRRIMDVKGILNGCFKYAIRCGYLVSNPAKDVSLPEPRTKKAERLRPPRLQRALTKKEIEIIFERFPEGHSDYIPLLLAYRCGLRLGEAFGVFVKDVDFKTGILHVRQQVQYDMETGNLYFTALKYCTPGTGRDIKLDPETLRILKRHINKLLNLICFMNFPSYKIDKNGILNTKEGTDIFPINLRYTDGTFISPQTIHYVSRVIHGKEGKIREPIPDWDFHMMRHTHASDCIAAGMSPVSVQKRLGHKNLMTTYKYYVHETETQVTESNDILEKMFV